MPLISPSTFNTSFFDATRLIKSLRRHMLPSRQYLVSFDPVDMFFPSMTKVTLIEVYRILPGDHRLKIAEIRKNVNWFDHVYFTGITNKEIAHITAALAYII